MGLFVVARAPAWIRVRSYSRDTTDDGDVNRQFVCYHLTHRTLLKIQGQDTGPFLQGIITNDMELLQESGQTAMYSHMLNVQGRTLYDIILYRVMINSAIFQNVSEYFMLPAADQLHGDFMKSQLQRLCTGGESFWKSYQYLV